MRKLWGIVWLSAADVRGASTGGVRATASVCSSGTRYGCTSAGMGSGPTGGFRAVTAAVASGVRLGARVSPSPWIPSPVN